MISGAGLAISVVEGDQATETDAARIRAAGCSAVQINTGTGCHLDADILRRGLEGDDKPLKYPHMFRAAEVVIITKSDLLPHVDFSIDRCLGHVRVVNRSIRSYVLAAITGEGVGAWYDWVNAEQSAAVQASV